MSPGKVRRRRHYLKALVELDDSCREVIELVEMLLEKGMCERVGLSLYLSLITVPNVYEDLVLL